MYTTIIITHGELALLQKTHAFSLDEQIQGWALWTNLSQLSPLSSEPAAKVVPARQAIEAGMMSSM
jgi:hypothetical protein